MRRKDGVLTVTYLVAWEFPNYPETEKTGKLVLSVRYKLTDAGRYDLIRPLLEAHYPGRKLASPLEFLPGGLVLGVYLSPDKEGFGRVGGNFMLWSVGGAQ